MKAAASQILRALRGHRSQVQLARRLGYRGNPITDWENGRRYPTAAEVIRVCRTVRVNVEDAFRQFHHPSAEALGAGDDAGISAWLDSLRGNTSIAELARRTGTSRYAIARWLHGDARPRLPDFLLLVDAITGRVPDLVAAIVPIEDVPALLARYRAQDAARKLAFEEPWTALILRVLETEAYQALPTHEPGWIAQRLHLSPAHEARCLKRLVEVGVLSKAGGLYHSIGPLSVDTRADPTALRTLKQHWIAIASDRLQSPETEDLFFYNLISLAHADLDRIRALQRAYFREVRAIVAASEPCETVALLNIQLIEWPLQDDQNGKSG